VDLTEKAKVGSSLVVNGRWLKNDAVQKSLVRHSENPRDKALCGSVQGEVGARAISSAWEERVAGAESSWGDALGGR